MKFSYHFIALFTISLFLFSCQNEKDSTSSSSSPRQEKQKKVHLPASTGKISSVYLYLDQTYQDAAFKDTLMYHLEQPYLLTPTPSPAIDITKYNFDYFSSGKAGTANNLIVANVKEESKIAQYVQRTLGKQQIEKALKGKQIALLRAKDVNATPQQSFFLLVDGFPNLKDKKTQKRLDEYAKSIIEDVTELDNQRIVTSFAQKRNSIAEQNLKQNFEVAMWVPRTYNIIDEKDNFIWLLHETPELYSNIVVYKQPRNSKVTLEQQAISMRDDFGKNITTHKENTRMTTNVESKPYPIQRKIKVNKKDVLETRGLWEMVNDQLGGGFVNYTFENDKNEAICIDGFVFYSGDKKRKKMRDIDAILSTIQLK